MSPTAKAREAVASATLPQGWTPLPAIGQWIRCAPLEKPGTVASLRFRTISPAGTMEVDGTIRRDGTPGRLCVRWVGDFTAIQAGIAWVTTALLVRA